MEQKPDPMKYIERRLEHKPSQAIVELALKKLETPLKKVQYKKEGTIKIITEEFRLEFSYRQVSPESDLNNMIKMDYEAFYNAIMIQSQLTQWRVLTDFRITDKSGNVVFDIKKELPGYIIFFHIIDNKQNQDKEQKQSSANPEARYIIIRGDISTPATILALLHETGHCKEYEESDEFEKRTFDRYHKELRIGGSLSAETLAKVLKRERDAWAYALRKIRPILGKTIPKDNVLTYIHGYALLSYSEEIRRKIEEGLSEFDWSAIL
jgi:hypothetical protein